MAGKKKVRKLLLAVTAFLTAAAVTIPTAFAFDVEENSRQHEELEKQNEEFIENLKKTNQELLEKVQYSRKLQEQISELTNNIKKSGEKIEALNVSIAEKQALIDEKMAEIADRLDSLRARLRSIYTAGDISTLEIILQARDFSDFVDKMELVQSISAYDDKLIKGLQAEMDKISDEKADLKSAKEQLEAEKMQMEQDKENVNTLSAENSVLIEELKKAKTDTQTAIKDNADRQAELERALADYNAEVAKQLRIERIRQMQEAIKAQRGTSSGDDATFTGDGSFVWPCPGFTYLTSLFDEWRGVSNHGAIDIAGSNIYGSKVIACYEGVVINTNESCPHDYGKYYNCGCAGGFGNYVMIDHGDGRVSIYAHLCSVAVVPGQVVSTGQLIGFVGTTGYSTGPHLHFELRYNGEKYNPLIEYER